MAFKFLPVALAVFIINFVTVVAEDHDDCYKYDAEVQNGMKKIDLYHKCDITDARTANNPDNIKCLAKEFKVLNEDGTINGEKLKSLLKVYTYPEYNDEIQEMIDRLLQLEPEMFYALYPKEVAKICPKDQIYGRRLT